MVSWVAATSSSSSQPPRSCLQAIDWDVVRPCRALHTRPPRRSSPSQPPADQESEREGVQAVCARLDVARVRGGGGGRGEQARAPPPAPEEEVAQEPKDRRQILMCGLAGRPPPPTGYRPSTSTSLSSSSASASKKWTNKRAPSSFPLSQSWSRQRRRRRWWKLHQRAAFIPLTLLNFFSSISLDQPDPAHWV